MSMIIGGLLDSCVADWINADRAQIINLSFASFMTKFKKGYMDDDWEKDTCHEVLGMSQASNTFWDYTVSLQSKNSLLHGTPSHLSNEQICDQLGAGMENYLSKKIGGGVNRITDFQKWLNQVKPYNDQLRNEREEYEQILKESRDVSRCANAPTEPTHCVPNTNSYHTTSIASTSLAPLNAPS